MTKPRAEDNMKLVYTVIHRYFPNFCGDEDLVQIGMLGLVKAANTFDENRGTSFSTYACHCIKTEIYNEFRNRKRLKVGEVMSLDYVLKDTEDDEITLGGAIVGEPDVEFFDVSDLYNKLSDSDKLILDLKRQGYTHCEIGEMIGRSHGCISYRLREIQRLYNKMYGR